MLFYPIRIVFGMQLLNKLKSITPLVPHLCLGLPSFLFCFCTNVPHAPHISPCIASETKVISLMDVNEYPIKLSGFYVCDYEGGANIHTSFLWSGN